MILAWIMQQCTSLGDLLVIFYVLTFDEWLNSKENSEGNFDKTFFSLLIIGWNMIRTFSYKILWDWRINFYVKQAANETLNENICSNIS